MSEKTIKIENIDPVDLYGANDSKLELIKKRFPKLKIIARGNNLKIMGDDAEVNQMEIVINRMMDHFHKYGSVSENDIENLTKGGARRGENGVENTDDIIVFGNGGIVVKARTANQRKMLESCGKNDMIFAIGPAGTGKTYTAVALAVRALKNKEVKKIVLTRPAVEAGEHLGFLPGDLKEKLDPYLQPLYDALDDMIPPEKLSMYIENRIIQIAPLAFMRGRTLDNAFVILDEAQNATESQLKMFLTRMGSSAKFVITGDLTQIDLPKHQPSGLIQAVKLLSNIEGIDVIYLDGADVLRHKLVKKIISIYDKKNK